MAEPPTDEERATKRCSVCDEEGHNARWHAAPRPNVCRRCGRGQAKSGVCCGRLSGAPFGKMSDASIARAFGCTRSAVQQARVKLGIPKYEPPTTVTCDAGTPDAGCL